MDNYLENWEKYDRNIGYLFEIGNGGIGDCIKYFMYLLQLCMQKGIRCYYIKTSKPLDQHLLLRFPQMVVEKSVALHNSVFIRCEANIEKMAKIPHFYIATPGIFYKGFSFDTISIPFGDVFAFSTRVGANATIMFPDIVDSASTPFTVVHLRLGDKYMVAGKKECPNDTRTYDMCKLCSRIEELLQGGSKVLFLCDNAAYKVKIKQKYPDILVTESAIGHTSYRETNQKQVLDTVSEFYLITRAERVIMASFSGFSWVASRFRGAELEKLF